MLVTIRTDLEDALLEKYHVFGSCMMQKGTRLVAFSETGHRCSAAHFFSFLPFHEQPHTVSGPYSLGKFCQL